MTDIVRVLRVIEYVGPRPWVEEIVSKSIHGTKIFGNGDRCVRAATVGTYPEFLCRSPVVVQEDYEG